MNQVKEETCQNGGEPRLGKAEAARAGAGRWWGAEAQAGKDQSRLRARNWGFYSWCEESFQRSKG